MDTNIRSLLNAARRDEGETSNQALGQAYSLLQKMAEVKVSVDTTEAVGLDLYVQCAEIALQHDVSNMADKCIQMFFLKNPPSNQFLCRAYLCQAQMVSPKDANSLEKLEKAVVYLLKSIELAKEKTRYHFIVYNASVLYWHFSRPFLKPNYRQYLTKSLSQVVAALGDVKDADYQWRAELMIALIECHLDAGNRSKASHFATTTASFVKKHVPDLYKTVFGLMIQHQLIDSSELQKEAKHSPELYVYHLICQLKVHLMKKEKKDYHLEIKKILYHMGVSTILDTHSEFAKLRNIISESNEGKENQMTGEQISNEKFSADIKLSLNSSKRPHLLLELARLGLQLNFADLAQICVEAIRLCEIYDQCFFIGLELVESDLLVKQLGDKQNTYFKAVVEVRLKAITRCEEAIMNAVRHNSPNLIQAGCVTLWNICLALLQPNLRHHVRKPLMLIAEVLEDIQSLLNKLRCQVHAELARCEEDGEQIQLAVHHLKKAIELDDTNTYSEQLNVLLHRLYLRSELYKIPERPEDQAGMIIEQARKANSGSIQMKRALLMKAGEALSPDSFLLIMDSESKTKEVTGRGPLSRAMKKAAQAKNFISNVQKIEGHLRRFGCENDKERVHLWGDLAKTARKQEIWDVCRAATRFTLLYDDERWQAKMPPPQEKSNSKVHKKISTSHEKKADMLPMEKSPLYERDLVRMIAEVCFINGEALIHLLRTEGVEMNDIPPLPDDYTKHFKTCHQEEAKTRDEVYWAEYCDWIQSLSSAATASFLRGMKLGLDLEESWLISSAASYIWNYCNHIFSQCRHPEIIDVLFTVLDGLKTIGYSGDISLLVNVCTAIANGLLIPWIPSALQENQPILEIAANDSQGKKNKAAGSKLKAATTTVFVSPEALPDLKRAIEVCEYGMELTNDKNLENLVSSCVRLPLLQSWVIAKQMAQQQIGKQLGFDCEGGSDVLKKRTQMIVALEMYTHTKNGLMEFTYLPSIPELVTMLENVSWDDSLIELTLWVRLAVLIYDNKLAELSCHCTNKALRLARPQSKKKTSSSELQKYLIEQELLCQASLIQGKILVDAMSGKISVRREALKMFLNSAKFGGNAKNYELVITAARQYWNTCLPLIGLKMERSFLREPLTVILSCIEAVAKKQPAAHDVKPAMLSLWSSILCHPGPTEPPRFDEDLTLRVAMYRIKVQSYIDQEQWEKALQVMDDAMSELPRTKHRLKLFKQRIIVKAKLGKNLKMDIQKFKGESEDCVAEMWHLIGASSKEPVEELSAYQNAILSLTSPETAWQKVDYLVEFGQWLYVKGFPLQDVLDQVEWAVDILLNMSFNIVIPPLPEILGQTSPCIEIIEGKKQFRKGAEKSTKKINNGSGGKNMNVSATVSTNNYDEKKDDIDLPPLVSDIEVDKLNSCKQLDYLIQLHILLAEIHSRPSAHYQRCLFLAYGFVIRLWKVSLSSVVPVMKEIKKAKEISQTLAPSTDGKGKKKEKPSSVAEKPKKGAKKDKADVQAPSKTVEVANFPVTAEEWSLYEVSEEIIEAFNHESMMETGISEKTITLPMLSFYYLDKLVSYLRDIGFNHLTLPVLTLGCHIARHLLKSSSLSLLTHCRCLQVCTELSLTSGCRFHERQIGKGKINMDEVSCVRETVYLWRTKQQQVIKEAKKQTTFQTTSEKMDSPDEKKVIKETERLCQRRSLSKVVLHHVWTDVAEVLLNQGLYQSAREFLSEAYLAAQAFDDLPFLGQIAYLMGSLAYEEAQYGQTIQFCQTAQNTYEGDEMYWYRTTLLLAKATFHCPENRNRCKQAQRILISAIKVFVKTFKGKPNRAAVFGYIVGKLHTELAKMQQEVAFNFSSDISIPKVSRALQSVFKNYQKAIEIFLEYNYTREAIGVMKEYARMFQHLAMASTEEKNQKQLYLQSLSVINDAMTHGENILYGIQVLNTPDSMHGVSLPVEHELAELQLEAAQLLVKMVDAPVKAEKIRQMKENEKESIIKIVEEFTRSASVYNEGDQEKEDCPKWLMEEALSKATRAYSLASNMPKLQSKSLSIIGQCFLQCALLKSPIMPIQFYLKEMKFFKIKEDTEEIAETSKDDAAEIAKTSKDDAAEIAETSKDDTTDMSRNGRDYGTEMEKSYQVDLEENFKSSNENEVKGFFRSTKEEKIGSLKVNRCTTQSDNTIREYLRHSKQITKMKHEDDISLQYLCQGTECLVQAINLALNNGNRDIAGEASRILMTNIGQYNPAAACQFLALYQSCEESLYLEELLSRAQTDPKTSQLSALLRQRAGLLRDDLTTKSCSSTLFQLVQAELEQWQAWKRICVFPNHLDLLKDFPSNFTFVILQHSPDRCGYYERKRETKKNNTVVQQPLRTSLYCALMNNKPNKTATVKVTNSKQHKQEQSASESQAIIAVADVCLVELNNLQSMILQYRQKVQLHLLKKQVKSAQNDMRIKMLETLDDSTKKIFQMQSPTDESIERSLDETFVKLVDAMESYLSPVISQLRSYFWNSSTKIENFLNHENDQEFLIVLADHHLLELPLEALKIFQVKHVVSMSRDISLQMFYHRFHQEKPLAAQEGGKKKQKKGGGNDGKDKESKKNEAKPQPKPSRLPFKDIGKKGGKGGKVPPLKRIIPPWGMGIDMAAFKYIVDPFKDCKEDVQESPLVTFSTMMAEYEQPFTSCWMGILGSNHTPSTGEWELYIKESGAFIFYGFEKLLSYLPPDKLSALNIPECSLVYILDQVQTSGSFSRQSKVDILKSVVCCKSSSRVSLLCLSKLTTTRLSWLECANQELSQSVDAEFATVLSLEKPVETALLVSLSGAKCALVNQWHCTLADNTERLLASMKQLLEEGKSTGESTRLLQTPWVVRTQHKEKEQPKKSPKKQKGVTKAEVKVEAFVQKEESKLDTTGQAEEALETPAPVPLIQQKNFNLVCYGLPNLIVTQM